MNTLSITCKPFGELSRMELYELLGLRDEVFVVGQQITAEPEIDGHDPEFHHVLGRGPSGDLIATARLSLDSEVVRVGRIAVRNEFQRRGIGTELMRGIHEILGARPAIMHAQAHLESWYATLGWRREGEIFLEAEIPHVKMTWPQKDPMETI